MPEFELDLIQNKPRAASLSLGSRQQQRAFEAFGSVRWRAAEIATRSHPRNLSASMRSIQA
jgi:hypothetical protein